MNAEKLDELIRLAGRLTGELKTERALSTNAFPFNDLERVIRWLLDQLVAVVIRWVNWVMPRLVKRVPERVKRLLFRLFAHKRKQ